MEHCIQSIVDFNGSKFEMDADELDNIQSSIDNNDVVENAWCELCPEQELECLECQQLLSKRSLHWMNKWKYSRFSAE